MEKNDLINILKCSSEEELQILREKIKIIKDNTTKDLVYFRALIEYSNICKKNCLYCGIRNKNDEIKRYKIPINEVVESARFAHDAGYGSIVIQSGEVETVAFTKRISTILNLIKTTVSDKLLITLSCGEQTKAVYKEWKLAGADRYLLRIETTNKKLYQHIHPHDTNHSLLRRMKALATLREVGMQVGSGIMVGLPEQTLDDIANDLLYFKKIDVDMIGLGPYIEHSKTPLYIFKDQLLPKNERFQLALNTTAALRILMPTINIAAATALQSLDPVGREKALLYGANVIMPNITPQKYRSNYLLYENKPCTDENPQKCQSCLETRVKMFGHNIAYHNSGDSIHYKERI